MNSRFVPFGYGFRPFFLLAGLFAALSMGAWLWLYRQGGSPLPGLLPQQWHAHEMIFGFIGAAIAGFMLTAVPSWTGGRGVSGRPLILLTLAWLAGRTAFVSGAALPWPLLVTAELVFLPALILTLAPPLLRSPSRNTPLLLVLLFLWLADAVFLIGIARGDAVLAAAALRGALDLVLMLITVIGGRIVPAFTENALRARGIPIRVLRRQWLEFLVLGSMLAWVVIDVTAPVGQLGAAVAGLAAIAHLARLAGWQGRYTFGQPIVWILHAAYAWLPLGLGLRALYGLGGFNWAASWQHALGAGAAATMIMAVMTRAALGHTGRPLRVAPATVAAYLALLLGVAIRVFGPALTANYTGVIMVAGALWLVAFGLFVLVYAPILTTRRADGKSG